VTFRAHRALKVMRGLDRVSTSFVPHEGRRGGPGHRRAETTPFFERLCPAM